MLCAMCVCFFCVKSGKQKPKDGSLPRVEPQSTVSEPNENTPLNISPKLPPMNIDELNGSIDPDEVAVTGAAGLAANEIFAKGVFLHTSKGPKMVKMKVVGVKLRWFTMVLKNGQWEPKRFEIFLSDIEFVQVGKVSYSFRQQTSSHVPDEKCFSLVSHSTTVDLEVDSKDDRDAVVAHFNTIMQEIVAIRAESDGVSSADSSFIQPSVVLDLSQV